MTEGRGTANNTGLVDDSPELVVKYRELESLLDAIAQQSSSDCSVSDLVSVAESHERLARRMSSIGHRRVMDVSDRDAHRAAGCRSLTEFLADRLRVTDVRRRLRAVEALSSHFSMQGELLPPQCPATANALAEGAIGPDHVAAIIGVISRIPQAVEPTRQSLAEEMLADNARVLSPKGIAEMGARILAHLDPDGRLTDDRDRARQRRITLREQDAQHMSKIGGWLDPATHAMFGMVLAAWAAPGMNNPDDDQSPRGSSNGIDAGVLRAAATRDSRSDGQRNHDALKALLSAALDGGLLGQSHRGLPPHVIIKITESELRERAGVGTTTTGATLPISDLIELAARSQMHLAVFADHSKEILYLGRAKRLASESQRFALFAAYGGCTKPGCPAPFSHTEIHHAEQDFAAGGRTDVDALAPACGPHNRMVGDRPGQYSTVKITTGSARGAYGWSRNTRSGVPPLTPTVNRLHLVDETFATQKNSLDDTPGASSDRGLTAPRTPPSRLRNHRTKVRRRDELTATDR